MAVSGRRIAALCGALLLLVAGQVAADEPDAGIKEFYGTYVGNARVDGDNEFRDIIVAIEEERKGFSIYTSTVIRKGPVRAVPGVKWRAETQKFVKSDTQQLYEPVLRESMFAQRRTPDLLSGDTVTWASIHGRTLGVYAMHVLADGHYELRVYERTLTELGMDLSFVRYRDGVAVLRLEGILARTAE